MCPTGAVPACTYALKSILWRCNFRVEVHVGVRGVAVCKVERHTPVGPDFELGPDFLAPPSDDLLYRGVAEEAVMAFCQEVKYARLAVVVYVQVLCPVGR